MFRLLELEYFGGSILILYLHCLLFLMVDFFYSFRVFLFCLCLKAILSFFYSLFFCPLSVSASSFFSVFIYLGCLFLSKFVLI